MNTFVVAFAGHSGAGKSTLINELASLTGSANVLRIDDYGSSSYPRAVTWLEAGADPNEFQTPQFFADVRALKNGESIVHPDTGQMVQPARFLLIEEPFGRGRTGIRGLIDFSVYVDTPLEIALARRLLRISKLISQGESDVTVEEHLEWYLRVGRSFYLAVEQSARKDCDLVVDGMMSTGEMGKLIYEVMMARLQN